MRVAARNFILTQPRRVRIVNRYVRRKIFSSDNVAEEHYPRAIRNFVISNFTKDVQRGACFRFS